MIIKPKIRGFICTTAHPVGCAKAVELQISHAKKNILNTNGPKKILCIGGSTGYGLASRITAAFGYRAATIGVSYERPAAGKRTASAGWYNTAAFETFAQKENLYAKSINGDAFSDEIRTKTADLIQQDLQQIDLLIYSVAAPRRIHPQTGTIYNSVLKPIGSTFTDKTVDVFQGHVKQISLDPATSFEIENTINVMGGDDWQKWISFLLEKNLLAPNFKTVAYSYIGPKLTHAIYRDGTIGQAKKHLHNTAKIINDKIKTISGKAYISINKAVVTQASAAIPVVPLYMSLLFKFMKENNTHEGCIEQINKLFSSYLYNDNAKTNNENLIYLDTQELDEKIQQKITAIWPQVTTENLNQLTDIEEYRKLFYQLFGFEFPDIDYNAEVDPNFAIDSIK